ncbi:hypothetical protein [Sulfurimonas autotrophica]|uniref:DUF302 domain-containing protein n=1 Tax=Sulfurimonas autotrophica (strain ATCC BAA-671 / DSM 16294 / JCM 11897 / OK10) TaxID=563040 RepID=E0UV63_SULAO|nr:hypothetical protein [Sulfurimonas autotrophica]ADN09645.1 conserved hypothetical protein [Sulfurimonas autotrophica DSM 16294]
MKKNIITALIALSVAFFATGCSTMHMGWTAVTQQHKLDDGAMPAYDDMFTKVAKYGDPARAMMKEWKVDEGISGDDVRESIAALTEEYNMRLTGYVKMYTKEDAKPNEVKEARIWSLCNLTTAKVFLNYSRYYGGFMPCRIMYIRYGNGDAYLISMDMTLAIHGGYTLPPEMLKMATLVKTAMEKIPERAAQGDF